MSVADEIIERFMAVFGEPKTTNPDLFITEFARSMDGYDEAALRKAADKLIASSTFWPKPAELLAETRKALADAARHRKPHVPAEHEPIERREVSPEAKARTDKLVADLKAKLTPDSPEPTARPIDASVGSFYDMQRNSPNRGLHMTREGLARLTEQSRRQTGERDE